MKFMVFIITAQICIPSSAFAGSALQEANRCERFLGAIFKGDANMAIQIEEEEYPAEPESDKSSKAKSLEKTIALVRDIGGGLPVKAEILTDLRVDDNDTVIKRQHWLFPNGKPAFVGCAMYTLTNGQEYATLKFEDDLNILTSELTQAAASRTRSPPQRP